MERIRIKSLRRRLRSSIWIAWQLGQ